MNTRNDLEVIINNKRYTLSGYESEEYLQRIASFINSKYAEFRSNEGYNHLDTELKNVLMQINLADDYYKMERRTKELEEDLARRDRELFELKHTLVTMQTQVDELTEKLVECNENYNEAQKTIIRLESEAGK